MDWLIDRSLPVVTALAAIIGAVASLWTARKLSRDGRRPLPTVVLHVWRGAEGSVLNVHVHNRADAPIDVRAVTVLRPRGTMIARNNGKDAPERVLEDFMALARADASPGPAGSMFNASEGAVGLRLHPSLPSSTSSRISMRLTLSWSDRAMRTFKMDVHTMVPADKTISPVDSH